MKIAGLPILVAARVIKVKILFLIIERRELISHEMQYANEIIQLDALSSFPFFFHGACRSFLPLA